MALARDGDGPAPPGAERLSDSPSDHLDRGGYPFLSLRDRLHMAGLAAWGEAAALPLTAFLWGACLLVALALLRVQAHLPPWAHSLLLGMLVLGMGAAVWRLVRLPWPDVNQTMRRLEADSGEIHRPLDVPGEALACGDAALWERHRQAMERRARSLSPGWPRPVLAARDPHALRFIAPLLLVVALSGGTADWQGRLGAFLTPELISPGLGAIQAEIWIEPPTYTGQPPLRLPLDGAPRLLTVPAGSLVKASAEPGWGGLRLEAGALAVDFHEEGSSRLAQLKLKDGDSLTLRRWGWPLGRWPLAVIADAPPKIAFSSAPEGDDIGRLRLRLTASDDYGVLRLWLRVSPEDGADPPQDHALPSLAEPSRQVNWTGGLDLAAHDWAGRRVSLMPMAEDGGGWQAAGEPVVMELPRRRFSHPVAQALDRWRAQLGLAPRTGPEVAEHLSELLDQPEALEDDLRVYLALATARLALMAPKGFERDEVRDLLWNAAIRLEDGALTAARAELDEVRRLLDLALAEKAPPARIEALLNRLEVALERWLQAMAETAPILGLAPPGAQVVDEDELTGRLEALRDLAQSGEGRQMAQRLAELSRLIDQLENAGRTPPPDPAALAVLERLKAITHQQQDLLDHSLRMAPPSLDDEDVDVPGPPSRQGPAQARRDAKAQAALAEQLEGLARSGPEALRQAHAAMRAAAESLSEGFWAEAAEAQGLALTLLRKETSTRSKVLEGGGGGGLGERLGRGTRASDGQDTKVPLQGSPHPARSIQDEIRKRVGEPARPENERNYLKRLLRTE